jgi:hypothetical protein
MCVPTVTVRGNVTCVYLPTHSNGLALHLVFKINRVQTVTNMRESAAGTPRVLTHSDTKRKHKIKCRGNVHNNKLYI